MKKRGVLVFIQYIYARAVSRADPPRHLIFARQDRIFVQEHLPILKALTVTSTSKQSKAFIRPIARE